LRLSTDENFIFVFIGEGVRKKDVTDFKIRHQLRNMLQLPYQPRSKIHLSLGSADVQVVIMGEGKVGFTHPNKVYGAMFSSKPVLYIGPEVSHITAILHQCPGNIAVQHQDVDRVVSKLQMLASDGLESMRAIGLRNREFAMRRFSPLALQEQMVSVLIGDIESNVGPLAVVRRSRAQLK
jgi:colanic acid biosynthesis glycosyl transferase WcaI